MAMTNAEKQKAYRDRHRGKPRPVVIDEQTAQRIRQMEAENARLRAEIARLESDRRLGRDGALAVEQLAAVKAYAPRVLAEALEWTRTH